MKTENRLKTISECASEFGCSVAALELAEARGVAPLLHWSGDYSEPRFEVDEWRDMISSVDWGR
jgi:hypothetical protein